MYDSIKVYTEQSYKFDYNIINQEEFFSQLKPRIRHRLVQILFNPFVFNFSYMFKDDGFESGSEFKNDFLTNIYSRLYLPRNDIIHIGDNFRELMMIQQGCVNLFVRYKDEAIDHDYQFFTLPTFSYFGDYQLLYNLKSQINFRADKCALLICLCIKKDKLLELMDEYPDARKFYMDRAWNRRTEFRRRQKKFMADIEDKLHNYSGSNISLSFNSKKDENEFDEDSVDDINNIDSETEQIMKQKKRLDSINDTRKFFYDIDPEAELMEDFSDSELEMYSDDEIQDEEQYVIEEDDKHICELNKVDLHSKISFLEQSISKMSNTMNVNLQKVTNYIKLLQEKGGDQVQPDLQKLQQVHDELRKQLECQLNSEEKMDKAPIQI